MNDAELARQGLLTVAELPVPVTGQDQQRNRAPCGPRALFRHVATGIATSPRFVIDAGRVQQTVLLFRDQTVATHAFNRLSSPTIERCLERYVRGSVREEARGEVGPVTERILNVEPRGQQTTAYRMLVPVYTPAPANVAIDVLLNRIGRSISSVSVIWTTIPEGIAVQEALAKRIASHLQRTLG